MMTRQSYRERLEHVLKAVAVAVALLGATPIAEALFAHARRDPALASYFSDRDAVRSVPAARLVEGDPIARLKIERLGVDVPVLEGVATSTLAQAPGHLPGTALPGDGRAARDAVIAIPRDSEASRASALKLGDRFEMRTPYGAQGFRVVERRVLAEREIAGLRERRGRPGRIVLVTPFPADTVGPAPSRLAIIAERA
jgi:sortase A